MAVGTMAMAALPMEGKCSRSQFAKSAARSVPDTFLLFSPYHSLRACSVIIPAALAKSESGALPPQGE